MADVYTVQSLAKETGTTPKAVVKWIKSGQLRAANLGSWLFPHYVMGKGDIVSFLHARETKQSKKYRKKQVGAPSPVTLKDD